MTWDNPDKIEKLEAMAINGESPQQRLTAKAICILFEHPEYAIDMLNKLGFKRTVGHYVTALIEKMEEDI